MSSATVQLNPRTALQFDTIEGVFSLPSGPGVLLCIQRPYPEDLDTNLALIPAAKIGVVIACLQLVQKQLQGVRCHDGSACAAGQRPCPSREACGVLAVAAAA